MPIVLYRVDERLIHGQVIIGWGHELRPDRYLVVDDQLAESDWEQELYRLSVADADVVFATVDEAAEHLAEWRSSSLRSVLLTRDIPSMRRLAGSERMRGEQVNLGGLHHAPGKEELLPYLFVTPGDRDELMQLASSGVEVSARDLPDAHRVTLDAPLRSRG